ncbi:MAG: hypothetical protein U5K76_15030 [Woeseiaceae bacterium]|nr:hypothetical protein [Woeseiaceae bacterium]
MAVPKIGVTPDGRGALQFGLNASIVATAVALLAFGWSFAVMPDGLIGKAYFEILFWGGGHALQVTWTLLMLVSWLRLASATGARLTLEPAHHAVDVCAGPGKRLRNAIRVSRP